MNPRKPTRLHIIQGTQKPCRTNKNEPTPTPALLTPPAYLPASVKRAFREFARIIADMGVLTVADASALEALAHVYVELKDLRASLAKKPGLTYESVTTGGGIKPQPELSLISDADKRLRAWLGVFGLTPADRARVSATQAPNKASNPFAAIG